VKYQ